MSNILDNELVQRKVLRGYPKIDQFFSHIKKTNKCWLWIGGKTNDGYGVFQGEGAHRFSYTYHKGPIPKGLFVCHSCDIPPCVNPKHLWAGTNAQNMQDALRKKIQIGPSPKLTLEQMKEVKAIGYSRAFWKTGKQYGVSRSAIQRILKNELSILK